MILLGAGGHGRDVLDAAQEQGRIVIGFLDEDPKTHGAMVNEVPVLGGLEWLWLHTEVRVVAAVGSPLVKRKFTEFLHKHHVQIASPIVHPRAYVSCHAVIGNGTVILAGSAIQPQVTVGHHVYISTVCTLGHDVTVADFASVHPGVQIGGGVTVESGSFIGSGVTILPGVTIGAWATVGAGAVVIHDLPSYCTAVGVPARVIKHSTPHT